MIHHPTLAEIIDTELYLFGQYGVLEHYPEAVRFLRLRTIPEFSTLFHEARSGLYCGQPKFTFHSDLAINRGLDNFEFGLQLIAGRAMGFVDGISLSFQLKSKDDDLPEALWLCAMNYGPGPAARVGLNLHYENGAVVATVANIQGKNKQNLTGLKRELADRQYWAVEAVSEIIDHLPPEVKKVRGIASTSHPSRNRDGFDKHRASCLYDLTFRHSRINMKPIRNDDGVALYYELIR